MEYTPLSFLSKLWVSSALTGSSPFPSLSASQLPLTCWHLLGASLSHLPGSSYSSLFTLRWKWKDDFLPLASVLLAEAECWGISWDAAEVLYRQKQPPHPPSPLFIFLPLISFSLEWCHTLGENDCHCQGDRMDSCSVSCTDAAQIKVIGQWSANALSMRNGTSEL